MSCLRCLVAPLDVPYAVSGVNPPCILHPIHPSHPIHKPRCCRIQYESQASCQRCVVSIWIHPGWLSGIKTKRSENRGSCEPEELLNCTKCASFAVGSVDTSSKTYSSACIHSTTPGFLCSHDYWVPQSIKLSLPPSNYHYFSVLNMTEDILHQCHSGTTPRHSRTISAAWHLHILSASCYV